jgi:Helix-turn-helix domain/HRDC domain
MILQTRIKESSLYTDPRIVAFSERSFSEENIREELQKGRNAYERAILLDCFDFTSAINHSKEFADLISAHPTSFNAIAVEWTGNLFKKLTALEETAKKFRIQLGTLFPDKDLENDSVLQTRVIEAVGYFTGELQSLQHLIQSCPIVTDAYTHARPCNDLLRDISAEISSKEEIFKGFKEGFSLSVYQERKKAFIVPAFNVNIYAGSARANTNKDVPHPELHQRLRKVRDAICAQKNSPIYMVAGTQTLYEMAKYLPQDLDELSMISGFGKARLEQFGQQFLDVIQEHAAINGLSSLIHEKSPKRQRKERIGPAKKKGETYMISLRHYKEGKSISDIAKERNLAISTIESHLATFVETGEISIENLVSQDKINKIENALNKFPGTKLTELKQKLGEDIDYGEIRFVIAAKGTKLKNV